MLGSLNKALDNYRFNDAAGILYEFIWHEFCDWYLELIKPDLVFGSQQPVSGQNKNTQIVLYKVLEKALRCLHPFMPFITEEIWQKLNGFSSSRVLEFAGEPTNPRTREPANSIMTQAWPHIQKQMIDKPSESRMRLAIDVITVIRNLKSQMRIPQTQNVRVLILCKDKKTANVLDEVSKYIAHLAKLESLDIRPELIARKKSVSAVLGKLQLFLEVEGLLDIESEINKLNKEIGILSQDVKSKESRLKNQEFIKKAPAEVVDKEKESLLSNKEKLIGLRKIINELKE